MMPTWENKNEDIINEKDESDACSIKYSIEDPFDDGDDEGIVGDDRRRGSSHPHHIVS